MRRAETEAGSAGAGARACGRGLLGREQGTVLYTDSAVPVPPCGFLGHMAGCTQGSCLTPCHFTLSLSFPVCKRDTKNTPHDATEGHPSTPVPGTNPSGSHGSWSRCSTNRARASSTGVSVQHLAEKQPPYVLT